MSEISVSGLALSDRLPGVYPETLFAQGVNSIGGSARMALLIANKGSGGTAVEGTVYGPDTLTAAASRADWVTLFADGSPMVRMFDAFVKTNPSTPLYGTITASVGASADGYVVATGTATGNGSINLFVGTSLLSVSVLSGDSPTVIHANIAAAVNGQASLPVSATSSSTSAYLVAKVPGLRGNLTRIQAQTIGPAFGVTVSPTVDQALTHGGTTDSVTNALAAIVATRFYYIIPEQIDATNLGAIQTQIDNQASPLVNIRQRMVCGSVDTLGNATSLANTLNDPRAELVWHASSDKTPGELAATAAAVYSLEEQSLFGSPGSAQNFDSYGSGTDNQSRWTVPSDRSLTQTTRSQFVAALNAGITPVRNTAHGRSEIVSRITTKSLTNGAPDYRVADGNIPTVVDSWTDSAVQRFSDRFSNKLLGNDVPAGQKSPNEMVTPSIIKSTLQALVTFYEDNGLLLNAAEINKDMVVQLSQTRGRVGASVPLQTVPPLHQFALSVRQVA